MIGHGDDFNYVMVRLYAGHKWNTQFYVKTWQIGGGLCGSHKSFYKYAACFCIYTLRICYGLVVLTSAVRKILPRRYKTGTAEESTVHLLPLCTLPRAEQLYITAGMDTRR